MLAHTFILALAVILLLALAPGSILGNGERFYFWRWRASSQKYSKNKPRGSARSGIVLLPVTPNFIFNIGERRADFY